MRFPTLAAAVGLLSTAVEAAPRHRHVDKVEARYIKTGHAVGQDAAVGVAPRSHNHTRTGSPNQAVSLPEGCPTGRVFVWTTTIDVTVYVTPMANFTGWPKATSTEPCDDETTTPAPSAEPCTDDVGSTLVTSMTRGPFANSSVATPRPTADDPCETGPYRTSTDTSSPTQPPKTPMPTAPFGNRTAATEPCDETTTGHVPSIATGSASSQPTLSTSHVPTMPPQASTTCVIDTSMTPVAKSTLSSTPAATATPTETICERDGATGTPSPDITYCGIRGPPAGAFFLAEFAEDRRGVPVTEEGCFQFCDSAMEDARGCRSYRYYTSGPGAPRCELYGMSVSRVVRAVDGSQPGRWYDLGCGSPDAQAWLRQASQHGQGAVGGGEADGSGKLGVGL